MRRVLFIALMATVMIASMVGSAAAGEITGNGERPMVVDVVDGHTILHAKSACAFSGLNDDWAGDPDVAGTDGFYRTQSWGQLPKVVRDAIKDFSSPGIACRGNVIFEE